MPGSLSGGGLSKGRGGGAGVLLGGKGGGGGPSDGAEGFAGMLLGKGGALSDSFGGLGSGEGTGKDKFGGGGIGGAAAGPGLLETGSLFIGVPGRRGGVGISGRGIFSISGGLGITESCGAGGGGSRESALDNPFPFLKLLKNPIFHPSLISQSCF
jgi:hypothetical protein